MRVVKQGLKGLLSIFTAVVITTLSIQGVANANPELVADLVPGLESSNPQFLQVIDEQLHFTARNERYYLNSNGDLGHLPPITPTPLEVFKVGDLELYEKNGSVYSRDANDLETLMYLPPEDEDYGSWGNVTYHISDLFEKNSDVYFILINWDIGRSWTYKIETLYKYDISLGYFDNLGSYKYPTPSEKYRYVMFKGQPYFSNSDDDAGTELWTIDNFGFQQYEWRRVADIRSGANGSYPESFVVLNDELFFIARGQEGRELWKMNANEEVDQVVDIYKKVAAFDPRTNNIHVFNEELYFIANHKEYGYELWKSDGTSAGTVLVSETIPGPESLFSNGSMSVFRETGDYFYFHASNSTSWVSDGSDAGTRVLFEGEDYSVLDVVGNKIFARIEDNDHGDELWVIDTALHRANLVKDIYPGSNSSFPIYLGIINGKILFKARDDVHGRELWVSDGTEIGTHLIKDIREGFWESDIRLTNQINSYLYFLANDGINGEELWVSNGTASGTVMLGPIHPETDTYDYKTPHPLNPLRFVEFNGALYFAAYDGIHGTELWKYTPPKPATGTGIMGDYVWRDDNGDGIQSPGEPGLANITVELQSCTGDLVTTTTTDASGHFSFTEVAPAFFQMQFKLPAGHTFSPEKSTDLFKLDSNANVNTGVTPCLDMTQGWKRLAIDAGMVPDAPTGGNPAMTLAISANGDSTLKPGPVLATGGAVSWTYSVANTGGTVLSNVAIRGRQKLPVFGSWTTLCSIGTVHPGTTGSCSTTDAAAVSGVYKALIVARADSSDGTKLESVVPAFYKGESGTPPPAENDVVTLKNAIYFTGSKKLWIRATSDASPAGSATITATITVDGVERELGNIGWKAGKSFYQQVFFDIASAPSSVTLSSDLGGVVSGDVQVRN